MADISIKGAAEPAPSPADRRAARIGGLALTILVALFFALDAGMKLADLPQVREAEAGIGWPLAADRAIGLIELAGLVLYAMRRTATLGAIWLTGLLGGAVAAHMRIGSPLFSHVLFGVYVGVLMWGALWLREPRVRALTPIRR
jgi:hypothetical protein